MVNFVYKETVIKAFHMTSKIIGIGNCIPAETITNVFFNKHILLDKKGIVLKDDNFSISEQLKKITGIEERRYADHNQVT